MSPPFIVCTLPRSRSAWVARFLTYRDWTCRHEYAVQLREPEDIRRVFATPNTGAAETAAAQAWALIKYYVPSIRTVVIMRPVADVVKSVLLAGAMVGVSYDVPLLWRNMEYGQRCLKRIAANPGVLCLHYDDLDQESGCGRLFEYCLPYEWDADWWRRWRDVNVQVDMREHFRYYFEHRTEIELLKSMLKREMIRLRRSGELPICRPPVSRPR